MTVDNINGVELQSMIEGGQQMTIVDLRSQADFGERHIQGAINIPFEQLQESVNKIPRDQEVVLVCYHGASSLSAAEFLDAQGYRNLSVLEGGMEGWAGKT